MRRNLHFLIVTLFLCPIAYSSEVSTETICHKYVQVEPVKNPSFRVPQCRVEGATLYWEGVVTDEVIYELSIRQQTEPIQKLQLNTYGGSTEAAILAARFIREHKIETEVRKGAVCMSACTLIFQAGTKRTAHPKARFMYHPARWGSAWYSNWSARCEKNKKENLNGRELCRNDLAQFVFEVQEITNEFFGRLLHYGMKPEFIKDFLKQPIEQEWFENGNFSRVGDWEVEAQDLVKYNVVQELTQD